MSSVWDYWYFSQQSWFQLVTHPAWHFTWCTLAYKLNKQGDIYSFVVFFPNSEPVCSSMSSSNCCFFLLPTCMLSHFSCVWLFSTLWTVASQAPLSMEFSRQGYWSGFPCSPPGYLPDTEIKHVSWISCFGRWVLYHWATRETHARNTHLLFHNWY